MEKLDQLTSSIQNKLNIALSSLTGQTINIALKHHEVVPISSINACINTSEQVIAVYIPIIGEVKGDLFVLLSTSSAYRLADTMLKQPMGSTQVFTDITSSAIKELGNITSGVIVTEMANLLKMSLMLTVPNLASGQAGAIIDHVLIDYTENSMDCLLIDFPFTIDTLQIAGNFLIMFDHSSSDKIAKNIMPLNQTPGAQS